MALSEKSANSSSSSSETAEIILKGRGQRSDGDEITDRPFCYIKLVKSMHHQKPTSGA